LHGYPALPTGRHAVLQSGKSLLRLRVWEYTPRGDHAFWGRFVPVDFVSHFLRIEQVAFVELFSWFDGEGERGDLPDGLPWRWLDWSEFLEVNDRRRLRDRILYRIADSRSELSRTWPILERDRRIAASPRRDWDASVDS
jgi:hypothetical protein